MQQKMRRALLTFAAALGVLGLTAAASPGRAPLSADRACTRWRLVASPAPPDADWTALEGVDARSSSNAWAVGWYTNHSPGALTYTQHWDGKAWTYVPSPNGPLTLSDNQLNDVAVVGSADTWGVGFDTRSPDDRDEPLFEHWDGASWSIVDIPARGIGTLYAVGGSSSKDIWAVGQAVLRIGVRHALLFHWDGRSWHAVRPPKRALNGGGLYALAVRGRNDVWAAGAWDWSQFPLALHWNGRSWRVVRLPRSLRGELHGIAMPSRRRGWAVGGAHQSPLAVRWDGRHWKRVRTPRRYTEGDDHLEAVGVLPGGTAWAVGYGTPDFAQMIVQRWNGHRWRNTRFRGLKPGWLNDVSRLTTRDGWAVGARFYFTGSGGYSPLTEHLGRC
jgi:hypothetical protein